MNRFVMVVAMAVLATFTTLLAGCSGGGSSTPQGVTVSLTGNDQMKYDKTAFTVPAGAKVTLKFAHTGKMTVTVMGHNVTILKKGEDALKFGQEIGTNGGTLENDYLPPSIRDRVVTHTKLIGGGEKTVDTFTAPTEPGDYPFLCTFPGHYMSMHGIMTVK